MLLTFMLGQKSNVEKLREILAKSGSHFYISFSLPNQNKLLLFNIFFFGNDTWSNVSMMINTRYYHSVDVVEIKRDTFNNEEKNLWSFVVGIGWKKDFEERLLCAILTCYNLFRWKLCTRHFNVSFLLWLLSFVFSRQVNKRYL